MLAPAVIGNHPHVLVMGPSESQFLLDFEHCGSCREEGQPLLARSPHTRHVYLAVGVSTSTGRQIQLNGESNGDHFVAMHLDVINRYVVLMDSFPTACVSAYIESALYTLSSNVYGQSYELKMPAPRLTFFQRSCLRQLHGSSDCAVCCWTNIAVALTKHQVVPAFENVTVHADDVCRDTFRWVYKFFYDP